jgi:hypothetical protein
MNENLAKRGRIDDNNNDIIINSKTVSRVNLEKIETSIYEKFYYINNQIQLKTELKIAEIKESNGYDINVDESNLTSNLRNEISNIQNRNEELFNISDTYQNDLKKKFFNMNNTENDLLEEQTNEFILNELNIEFVPNDDELLLGHLIHKKDMIAFKVNLIDFVEIIKLIDPFCSNNDDKYVYVRLRILENGNYFITFKLKFQFSSFLVYDPIEKRIKYHITLPFFDKVEELNVSKNKTAVMLSLVERSIEVKKLKIYDDHLNEINTCTLSSDLNLIGANEAYIFLSKNEKIYFYDWSLQKLKKKIKFQSENENNPFYVPNESHLDIKIFQFEKTKDFNVVRLNLKDKTNHRLRKPYVIIYDRNGNTIRMITATGRFNINLFKNEMIITFGPELLRYYDLKGILFKEECLQKPVSIVKDSYYSIVFDANNNISVFKSR